MVGVNTAKHFYSNMDQDQLLMTCVLSLTHKMGHGHTKDINYLVITHLSCAVAKAMA
jgi:hypothetical protein